MKKEVIFQLLTNPHKPIITSLDQICRNPVENDRIVFYDKQCLKNEWKKDGYDYKTRKINSIAIREDHLSIKINGNPTISALYSHSKCNSVHRRAFWLIEQPDIIMVHYLVNKPETSCKSKNIGHNDLDPHVEILENKSINRNTLNVIDFAPNSSCANGGEKVLLLSNDLVSKTYKVSCYFGSIRVACELVQPGVFRTQTPPHMPGKVQLVVLLDILDDLDNMRIIKTITSSGIVFEYKDPAANPLMRNQLLVSDFKKQLKAQLDILENRLESYYKSPSTSGTKEVKSLKRKRKETEASICNSRRLSSYVFECKYNGNILNEDGYPTSTMKQQYISSEPSKAPCFISLLDQLFTSKNNAHDGNSSFQSILYDDELFPSLDSTLESFEFSTDSANSSRDELKSVKTSKPISSQSNETQINQTKPDTIPETVENFESTNSRNSNEFASILKKPSVSIFEKRLLLLFKTLFESPTRNYNQEHPIRSFSSISIQSLNNPLRQSSNPMLQPTDTDFSNSFLNSLAINMFQLINDQNGSTLIHAICALGYVDLLSLILNEYNTTSNPYNSSNWSKVRIHQRDEFGRTPLFLAIYFGHEHIIKLLIDSCIHPQFNYSNSTNSSNSHVNNSRTRNDPNFDLSVDEIEFLVQLARRQGFFRISSYLRYRFRHLLYDIHDSNTSLNLAFPVGTSEASYYNGNNRIKLYMEENEPVAAKKIQKAFRSHKVRRLHHAATIIQSRYRAYKQRMRYRQQYSAIMRIQQLFRKSRLD